MDGQEFQRGVSPVSPGVQVGGRLPPADETVRLGWPGARPVRLDRPTSVMQRVTSRGGADDDSPYNQGWEDGRRVWKRIAYAAIAVGVLCMTVTAAVIVRWYEAVSQ